MFSKRGGLPPLFRELESAVKMPVSFRILKSHKLVYVRYEGHANIDETIASFGQYASHPDCEPGQNQLIDLSGLTGYDKDFARMMETQAQKADVFLADGAQPMVVYLSPTKISQKMSAMIVKSWEPFVAIIPIIVQSVSEACDILGVHSADLKEALKVA